MLDVSYKVSKWWPARLSLLNVNFLLKYQYSAVAVE